MCTAIRQEKEIKGIQVEKKVVKPLQLADNVTLYIENPKDASKETIRTNK